VIRAGWVAPLVVAALGLVGGGGCGKPSAGTGDAPASKLATPPPASPPPVDHLGVDELVEGAERAFGIALPRGLVVEERYPDLVTASGPMTVHALVQYLRPRLKGGSFREGDHVATFEHVTTPELKPDVDLTIRLTVPVVNRARIQISTTITPPVPALPDTASRWRQVGLTPEGKLLDPTHLD
jgi:hypothetical protein